MRGKQPGDNTSQYKKLDRDIYFSFHPEQKAFS